MKTGKSMMVAVIIPELSNMFSMMVLEFIEKVVGQKDYSVLISVCEKEMK